MSKHPPTESELIDAANAGELEASRWQAVYHLPARNGMPIEAWMEVQRNSTWDLVRRSEEGPYEVIKECIPNALEPTELFIRKAVGRVRATLQRLGIGQRPD